MPTDFITYAQNAEDVMLWRALRHVEGGFYIDVGAQDPVVDSVTKAFYEKGWRGINVEPVRHWYERLVEDRVHDVNLCMAAWDHEGEVRLFEIEGTGLSTSNPNFAKRHGDDGWKVHEHTVPCRTLDAICASHSVGTVHFLKIDCEGSEQETLSGMSLEVVRPWIILVEATEPLTTKQTWKTWEHLLTGRNYEFVYFDGLNRFYLSREHSELRAAFDTPPNPLDWAVRATEVRARESIGRLTQQLTQFQSVERSARAEAEREYLRAEAERLQVELKESRRAHELQRAELTSECDRLRTENVRYEAKLEDRDSLLKTRDSEIRARDSEIKARDSEIRARDLELTARDVTLELRSSEIKEREAEAMKLHESQRDLQARINELLASRSWRITAPLRLCSLGARRLWNRMLAFGFVIMRPFAHAARPMLRSLVRHERIRRPITQALGVNSRLVNTARLFLFGSQQSGLGGAEPSPDIQQMDRSPQQRFGRSEMSAAVLSDAGGDASALSERGRAVWRLMDEAQIGVHKEDGYANRP